MSTVAQRRVAAGAAWLDEVDPGWWELVELDRLDLASCDDCVLGQWAAANLPERTYGEGYFGSPDYGYAAVALGLGIFQGKEYGFSVGHGPGRPLVSFPELTEAWVDEILHRELEADRG